jgi:hypothetical protein
MMVLESNGFVDEWGHHRLALGGLRGEEGGLHCRYTVVLMLLHWCYVCIV